MEFNKGTQSLKERIFLFIEHAATDGAEITPEYKQEAIDIQSHYLYSDVLVDYWVVDCLARHIERLNIPCELDTRIGSTCRDSDRCITEWCAVCIAEKFVEEHKHEN